jgi:phosphate transport system substrate-binding protein
VVNNKNNWLDKGITVADLKKMWSPEAQGTITRWNQVNPAWPDQPLKLYGPGADSGTFEYFTDAVVGKAKSSRGDYTASEDDNVLVTGVSRDAGGLGYFGYAYYAENKQKLKAVPIIWKEGDKAVAPSSETVIDGTYQPLSRPIFVYLNMKSLDKPEVKEFVDFYMKNAETLVKEVKYVPLPSKAYVYNTDQVAKRVAGTKFGGENKVGLTIEELMKMEAKL